MLKSTRRPETIRNYPHTWQSLDPLVAQSQAQGHVLISQLKALPEHLHDALPAVRAVARLAVVDYHLRMGDFVASLFYGYLVRSYKTA